jgi:hypothetical protein
VSEYKIFDIYIYIYRERELDYNVMHSIYRSRAMDQFFVIKLKIVNSTIQNDFRMNI